MAPADRFTPILQSAIFTLLATLRLSGLIELLSTELSRLAAFLRMSHAWHALLRNLFAARSLLIALRLTLVIALRRAVVAALSALSLCAIVVAARTVTLPAL